MRPLLARLGSPGTARLRPLSGLAWGQRVAPPGISERTRDALAAAKARGKRLGNPRLKETAGTNGAEENKRKAAASAANIMPIIRQIEQRGAGSLRQIAAELAARGVKAPGGS